MIERLKSPQVVGGLVALLGVAATALLLLTVSSGSTDAASPTPPDEQGFSSLATATPESVQAMDGLSPRAKLFLAEREDPNGAEPATEPLSGVAIVKTTAGDVVVAQFGDSICEFVERRGGGTCGSMEFIREGRLDLFFPTCESTLIVGLLPDSASGVTVSSGGVTSKAVPVSVQSNVYVAEVPSTDTTVSGTTASGAFGFTLPLSRAATGACPEAGR